MEPEEGSVSSPAAALGSGSQSRRGGQLVAGDGDGTLLPLGDGVLTQNLGIPIVVVLTKVT
jgi:hypothetical protein